MEARGLFPFAGIQEDPATGSAAGPLAAYMAREGVLPPEEERVVLQGQQIGRPSFLTVAVSGTRRDITDVRVGGSRAARAHGRALPAGLMQQLAGPGRGRGARDTRRPGRRRHGRRRRHRLGAATAL